MPISLCPGHLCYLLRWVWLEGQVRAWEVKQSPELPASSRSQPRPHTGHVGSFQKTPVPPRPHPRAVIAESLGSYPVILCVVKAGNPCSVTL